MKYIVAILLFASCATTRQTPYEAKKAEIVAFKESMVKEFSAFFNVAYYANSAEGGNLNMVRMTLIHFLVLLDELNACIAGADKVNRVLNDSDAALFCAIQTTRNMLEFMGRFGMTVEKNPSFLNDFKIKKTDRIGASGDYRRIKLPNSEHH